MRKPTAYAFLTGLLLVTLSFPGSVPAGAQESGMNEDCAFDEASTVDVLLLLDQSASLDRTDPSDQRVPGAKAVVASFASLAERIEGVRINLAGFGTEFESEGWIQLDESTEQAVLDRVDRFGDQDDDQHTDYAEALHGVVQEFDSSSASCKILYWFTDGQHDLEPGRFGGGLVRSYPISDPVTVTDDNYGEVMDLMPSVVCDPGGYADQLGGLEVLTDVLLLGSGEDMDAGSRRVLQGMGGESALDCGSGRGSFQDVSDASDLPFELACNAQFGFTPMPLDAAGGTLSVTDADVDASDVPYSLASQIRVIADGGVNGPPSISESTDDELQSTVNSESGLLEVDMVPRDESFELSLSGVSRACGFVTGVGPSPEISSNMPVLYQGESGSFSIVINGPRGRIDGEDLSRISLETNQGEPMRGESGWTLEIDQLPASETFELTATASAAAVPSESATATFSLNEPVNAPRIVSQPEPLEGEGTGPFVAPLEVDGRDGGTLCLTDPSAEMTDLDGTTFLASATFDGQECIELDPGAGQEIQLLVSTERQADAHQVLEFETTSTPQTRPDQSEHGVVALDLKVLPVVNTTVLMFIVAVLLLLLLGLLWVTMYGINRLVSRLPDVRRNRVRYGDFVAEVRTDGNGGVSAELVEAPSAESLRVPRGSPGRMEAGRLKMVRKVPLIPWSPPYAELSLGTDLVATRSGHGASQFVVVSEKKAKTSSQKATGPLVAIGLNEAQLNQIREGIPQRSPGVVILDSREARGRDAGEFAGELIADGLLAIGAELAAREVSQPGRTGGT